MIASSRSAVLAIVSLALAATFASSGCSSKSPTTFGAAADDASVDAGDDGAISSSSSSGGWGTSSGLGLGDTSVGSSSGMGTGTCKDGTYSGTFSCTFDFTGDGGPSMASGDGGGLVVTGTISFQLTQKTGTGETFVDMASGMFGGNCCLGAFSIGADVAGTLDCNSGSFTGQLANGTYTATGIWAAFIQNGTFSGPLTADYNGSTSSFTNGVWNLTVPGAGTCPGTWSATYTEQ